MKHLHMTIALISVSLFTLRFIWSLMNSPKLQQKWVKITPHVVDTCLLAVGVVMWIQLALNPLEQMWFAEKLLAVLAYIFTGIYTLKFARNNTMKVFGYLGAIGWVMLIVRVAMSKEAYFL
ncbi:SirB2 family protein [Thalassotalea agariperforans]